MFSECRNYRYHLERKWSAFEPIMIFAMLNPSTADAFSDDPTIRRCIGFAKRWGYGGVGILNLYALRSTDPAQLLKAEDPEGPDNAEYWQQQITDTSTYNWDRFRRRQVCVVCAWGAHPAARRKAPAYIDLLKRQGQNAALWCMGTTKDGLPRHPLYMPGNSRLCPYPAKWEAATDARTRPGHYPNRTASARSSLV